MTAFTRLRTARKQHKCDRCSGRIEPGEHYRTYAIPPGSDIGNEKWISGREHLGDICFMYSDEPEKPEEPW